MNITGPAVDQHFDIGDKPRFFHGRRVARTWIAVMDRKKAHVFFKNADDLQLIAVAEPGDRDNREGQQRHEELSFPHQMARWFDEACQHEAYDRLVVVAGPRMLGDIRKGMTPAVAERVVAEISKDMTNLSQGEIRRHLANIVYFRDRRAGGRAQKTATSG